MGETKEGVAGAQGELRRTWLGLGGGDGVRDSRLESGSFFSVDLVLSLCTLTAC